MMESRKNQLDIDGGQVKEDENIASYKQVPDTDTAYRKPLSKSKERLSSDGAEEKLLHKDDAKIVMVDAEAKYVVQDNRNGDARVELDANRRQFTGLTKDELQRYADDPFWVRLRWCMFVLFWALWVGMLAGAVAIIVRTPPCSTKTWFEGSALVEGPSDVSTLDSYFPLIERSGARAVIAAPCADAYEVLEQTQPSCFQQFQELVKKANEKSIKLIVDLTANFVSSNHSWFQQSVNRSGEYTDYFVWSDGEPDSSGKNTPPNTYLYDETAWTWNENRKQFYLHQTDAEHPDLNFQNNDVVEKFDDVLKIWMAAGAAGVRLQSPDKLSVSPLSVQPPTPARGPPSAAHTRPHLDKLLAHWAGVVGNTTKEPTVFTVSEQTPLVSALRPPAAAPLPASPAAEAVRTLTSLLDKGDWPAVQLLAPLHTEVARLALLLPAVPVLTMEQLTDNSTAEWLKSAISLRSNPSITHGHTALLAAPASLLQGGNTTLLAVARWKEGHSGFAAVHNPSTAARADLTALGLPTDLSLYAASKGAMDFANYTQSLVTKDVLIPPETTVVFSFVPKKVEE